MQNWVSFGKLAHDLVMSMQKIDSDIYPVVVLLSASFVLRLTFSKCIIAVHANFRIFISTNDKKWTLKCAIIWLCICVF